MTVISLDDPVSGQEGVTQLAPFSMLKHSERIVKGAAEFGRKAIEKVGETAAEFSIAIDEGDARNKIEKRCEGGEYDLVLMGSHGRTGINRALLGSVAESTVRHQKNSVYVARAAAMPEE